MATNIPSNEKQRPATKTTLPSKALIKKKEGKMRGFANKKTSKSIHLHQTNYVSDAKQTALRT